MLIIDLACFWLKISRRFDRFRRSPVQSCGVQRTPQWSARSTHNTTDGLRIIRVAEDFGWALDDGDNGPRSGRAFRENLLLPALVQSYHVQVIIDGPTYSMAFLDEAFGGLVHSGRLSAWELNERLDIIGGVGYRYTKLAAERYIRRADLMEREVFGIAH